MSLGSREPDEPATIDVMSIRKIAQLGEPVLRTPAREVALGDIGTPRVQALIDDMIETMRDADGAGIAAPQVYEPLRLCVIEVNENPRYPQFEPIPLMVLINPVVTPVCGAGEPPPDAGITIYEGCLSVPGLRGRVRRPRQVSVSAYDRQGRAFELQWDGVRAAIVQHENDHLNATLFVDRADPKTLTFLREYERHVPLVGRVVDPS
jgi:peptide deformylase